MDILKNTDFNYKKNINFSEKINFIRNFSERQLVVLTLKNIILICHWDSTTTKFPKILTYIILNSDDEIFNTVILPSFSDW